MSCISCLHYGMVATFAYRASGDSGSFFSSDGEANHHIVGWNEHGLVAIELNHDDPESEYGTPRDERTPGRLLTNVPAALRELAERVCNSGERLATGALWIDAETASACIPLGFQEGEEFLADYTMDDQIAFDKWQRLHSLSEQQVVLAVRLRDAAASGPHRLSPAEVETLSKSPRGPQRPLAGNNRALAQKCFAQIGIEWPEQV